MVHLTLGGILVQQGNVDEAVALYREGLRSQPNFPNLHFNLGVALLLQRKVDEAINELTKAVELRPWYTDAYAALGGALVLQGRQDEAVIQYQKALRLDPDALGCADQPWTGARRDSDASPRRSSNCGRPSGAIARILMPITSLARSW